MSDYEKDDLLKGTRIDRRTPDEEADTKVEEVWSSFWFPIILEADRPNAPQDEELTLRGAALQQVKAELFDYHNLMSQVSEVYDELTRGRISKPMTDPRAVIDVVRERQQEEQGFDLIEFFNSQRDGRDPETQALIDELTLAARDEFGVTD